MFIVITDKAYVGGDRVYLQAVSFLILNPSFRQWCPVPQCPCKRSSAGPGQASARGGHASRGGTQTAYRQSVPGSEDKLHRVCPAHSSQFTIYLRNMGPLEEKGRGVILTELSSHEIKYAWEKSILPHRAVSSLKAGKVKGMELGMGTQCTGSSYFPGFVVSILNMIIYVIET